MKDLLSASNVNKDIGLEAVSHKMFRSTLHVAKPLFIV